MISTPKRIVFVDDELHVLDGLRRALRPHRHEWTMTFCNGGEEALRVLTESPADDPVHVLVSDARMPGMSGAQLLMQVQARFPNIMCIILSGQADEESMHSLAQISHRFLSKPCQPELLLAAINQAKTI